MNYQELSEHLKKFTVKELKKAVISTKMNLQVSKMRRAQVEQAILLYYSGQFLPILLKNVVKIPKKTNRHKTTKQNNQTRKTTI